MISMLLPDIAICTSPGFIAVPEGMFSAAQTMPITFTAGFNCAMACMAPIIAAPPAMSYFIFSMPSAGLMEMPPVSNVMPFPTRPSTGVAGAFFGLVGHHDQGGWLLRSLGHSPERTHLQFFQLVCTVNLTLQPVLPAHFRGLLAQHGGGHYVARLIDQGAGKILRLAQDHAFSQAGLDGSLL